MDMELKAGQESFDGKLIWLFGTWVPKDLAVRFADSLARVVEAHEGGEE